MATIKVDVIGDSSKFKAALSDAADASGKVGKGFLTLGKAAAAAGVVLAGSVAVGLKKSLDAAGDLQENLNVLKATTNGTSAELAKAGKVAIALGKDTKLPAVSAGDAAKAMLELGRDGFTMQQSMKAARGTLLLVTAAQTDTATAAKVVTQNLHAFGLGAKDTNAIVDQMAGFMNTTGTSFDAFADSLTYTASISHTVGQSFADNAAQLAILSQKGIEGSMAGTGLRTILTSLGNESSKAGVMLSKLGISTVDSKGSFIGMHAVLQKLQPALAAMTKEQRIGFLQAAFGKPAMNAANILLGEQADAYDKTKKAIERKGQADQLAAAHMQGYNGALAKLSSALETLEIMIGQKVMPVATQFLDFLASVANAPSLSVAIGIAWSGLTGVVSDLWHKLSDAITGDSTKHILIGGSSIAFRNDGQGLASKFWDWTVGQIGTTPTHKVVVGGSVIEFKRDPTLRDQFTKYLSDAAASVDWSAVVRFLAVGLPNSIAPFSREVGKSLTKAIEDGVKGITLDGAKTALLTVGKVLAGATLAWGNLLISPIRGMFDVIGPQVLSGGEKLAEKMAAGIKTAPAKLVGLGGDLLNQLQGIVSSVASTAYNLAISIGERIADGAISGMAGLAGKIRSAAESGIKSGLSNLNPFSPVEHGGEIYIGNPIIEGAIAGIQNKTPSLKAQIVSAIQSAVISAKSQAMTDAGSLGSTIADSIQAGAAARIAATGSGPIAQQLAALNQQIADRQNTEQHDQLWQATQDAQDSGDPNAIRQAQQALDDWTLQQQANTLQAQLDATTTAIQTEADMRSTATTTNLTNLQDSFNRGLISQGAYIDQLGQILLASGQTYTSIGQTLGSSVANGFADGLASLNSQIGAILAGPGAIAKSKIQAALIAALGGGVGGSLSNPKTKVHAFASGGIVTGPTLGLIGEAGPEAVVPLSGGGFGGTTVNIYAQNLVSTKEELFEEARNFFIRTGRYTPGGVLGGF